MREGMERSPVDIHIARAQQLPLKAAKYNVQSNNPISSIASNAPNVPIIALIPPPDEHNEIPGIWALFFGFLFFSVCVVFVALFFSLSSEDDERGVFLIFSVEDECLVISSVEVG